MATEKPRITVTLEPRVHEVLRSISKNGGQPMSKFIAELLSENLPVFERMAVAFQRIAEQQSVQKKRISSGLDEAEAALSPLLEQALSQFDLFMTNVEESLGAGAEDRANDSPREASAPAPDAPKRTAKKAAATPPSNRGVRSGLKTRKK